jgi:GcrA cell cycle regulator
MTAEQKARLLALRGSGLSAGLIAMRIGGGLTRNAVIGYLHRQRLCWGSTLRTLREEKDPSSTPKRTRSHRFPAHMRSRAPKFNPSLSLLPPRRPRSKPVPILEPLRVFIADLERRHCHYVLGEPAEMTYCGLPRERGMFCAGHGALVYMTLGAEG